MPGFWRLFLLPTGVGAHVARDKIRRFLPAAPVTQEQAGISSALIEDLFLRHVHLKRCNTIGALSESMALAYPIVERVFRDVRNQRLLEVSGMVGDDYVFSADRRGTHHGRGALPGVPVRGPGARQPECVPASHPGSKPPGGGQPGGVAPGFRRPGGDRPYARSTGAGAGGAELDVPLRTGRHRQDQPGGEAVARLRRPTGDALCGRSGQSDHRLVRPGGARAGAGRYG